MKKDINIVLTTQRTGSTHLMDIISQVFDAHVEYEIFAPAAIDAEEYFCYDYFLGAEARRSGNARGERSMGIICEFLHTLHDVKACSKTLIFKLMIDQVLDLNIDLVRLNDEFNCKFLYLKRNNLCEVVLSRVRSARLGITHQLVGENVADRSRIYISPKDFSKYLADVREAYSIIEKIVVDMNYLQVSYEDLMRDEDLFMSKISKFFQMPLVGSCEAKRIKIGKEDWMKEVENAQDIIDYLEKIE